MIRELVYHVFVVLGGVYFDGIGREFAKDLRWFSGKRTFIDGGLYMRFSGSAGSSVTCFVFMWFIISLWTPNVSSFTRGS